MKIVSFKGNKGDRIGIQTDRGYVDFSAGFQVYTLVEKEELCPLVTDNLTLLQKGQFNVETFTKVLRFLEAHNLLDRYLARGKVKLNPPIRRPPKIVALGLNYASHAEESGREDPKEPIIF